MIENKRTAFIAAGLGLLLIPAGYFALATNDTAQAGAPTLMTQDQKLDGKNVIIQQAKLTSPGYIAVYQVGSDGKPQGEPVGWQYFAAGEHRDAKITLSTEPTAGSQFWATIYQDKDGDQKLDKAKDEAVWKVTELPASGKFAVR